MQTGYATSPIDRVVPASVFSSSSPLASPGEFLPVWQHPDFGPVNYRIRELSQWPDVQVNQTVKLMAERVLEDSKNPYFRNRAQGLFGMASGELGVVEGVWEHTKRNIRFQRDEKTGVGINGLPESEVVEVIIRPLDMASFVDRGLGTGDCDDFSMYVAANLLALGIPCSFLVVAADETNPEQFSHVYVVAYPMGNDGKRIRVPVDASHGPVCGWETRGYGRYQEHPLAGTKLLMEVLGTAAAIFLGGWLLFKAKERGGFSWM